MTLFFLSLSLPATRAPPHPHLSSYLVIFLLADTWLQAAFLQEQRVASFSLCSVIAVVRVWESSFPLSVCPIPSDLFSSPCFPRKGAWACPLFAPGANLEEATLGGVFVPGAKPGGLHVMLSSDQWARGDLDVQRQLCGCEGPLSPGGVLRPKCEPEDTRRSTKAESCLSDPEAACLVAGEAAWPPALRENYSRCSAGAGASQGDGCQSASFATHFMHPRNAS